MKCPECQHPENRVLETRNYRNVEIRRRRECLNCKARFVTVESFLLTYPSIVKKDGRREAFSKDKLRRGIQIACKKRPVSVSQIENVVSSITEFIQNSKSKEVPAQRIGESVVKKLRKLDDVAYIRFASVYKNFKDVNEFMHSLGTDGE